MKYHAKQAAMNRFTIEQSELELESKFASRLWSVVHDVPVLYEALLEELAYVGLSSMDLRPDAGNGSVGGAGLGIWLFGGKANVRIGLDGVRFQTSSPEPLVVDTVDGVIGAVRRASPELRFKNHAVSYVCHGSIEGMKAAKFVRRFVPNSVNVDGFGDCLGAGAALYFGEAPPMISSTLTLDISRLVQDGLFVRVFMVMDGAVGTGAAIKALAEQRTGAALRAVGLENP